MKKIKMSYYDRIGTYEGINTNKTTKSIGCDICHYWYFLNKGFKFQPYVYKSCLDLLMMSITLAMLLF